MKVQSESETKLTYYGAGVIVTIGVLGIISYYIYQSKTPVHQLKESPVHQLKETPDKFDMNKAIKWTRKVSLMIYTKHRS